MSLEQLFCTAVRSLMAIMMPSLIYEQTLIAAEGSVTVTAVLLVPTGTTTRLNLFEILTNVVKQHPCNIFKT